MQKTLIFATKRNNGEYKAEEIVTDLEGLYGGLEYGDVLEGEYQIWEYPTGRVFSIVPDKKVNNDLYYATPYNSTGTIWKPTLVEVGVDKKKVSEAQARLSK